MRRLTRSPLGTCLNVFERGRFLGNVYQVPAMSPRWFHDRAGCSPLGYLTADEAAAAIPGS